MAKVWILLAFTLSIPFIGANNCSEMDKIMNCNECFRCGGHWCKDPNEDIHCLKWTHDSWCSKHTEEIDISEDFSEPGDLLDPKYVVRTVLATKASSININYKATRQLSVKLSIVNTTQNENFFMTENTRCGKGECATEVQAFPKDSFCSATGGISESINIKVSFEGLSEETIVKYKVPCACACSGVVEKRAANCNRQGDFSCGVCTCYDGWTGPSCSKPVCEAKRGDVQCNNPITNVECSGNGVCGPCETCICDNNRIGAMYFDQYCADICMNVNSCDECLRDPSVGRCPQCSFPLFYLNFNETLLEKRDNFNRSIWMTCNETLLDGYHVEYVAMKDENYDTYFMIPPSDTTKAAIGAGGVNVMLPIGLILAAALVVAGGFVVYKFWQSRIPPVPLNDPMYTNIDAEDCTGENPLYKPPTSSFKNPTYGKW